MEIENEKLISMTIEEYDKEIMELDRDGRKKKQKEHSKLMVKWVNSILRRYSHKLLVDKKGLLLLNNHESYKGIELEKALKELRFDIVYFPPNCTSKLQPLDLVVNQPLKDLYDERFESYMASLTEKDT